MLQKTPGRPSGRLCQQHRASFASCRAWSLSYTTHLTMPIPNALSRMQHEAEAPSVVSGSEKQRAVQEKAWLTLAPLFFRAVIRLVHDLTKAPWVTSVKSPLLSLGKSSMTRVFRQPCNASCQINDGPACYLLLQGVHMEQHEAREFLPHAHTWQTCSPFPHLREH